MHHEQRPAVRSCRSDKRGCWRNVKPDQLRLKTGCTTYCNASIVREHVITSPRRSTENGALRQSPQQELESAQNELLCTDKIAARFRMCKTLPKRADHPRKPRSTRPSSKNATRFDYAHLPFVRRISLLGIQYANRSPECIRCDPIACHPATHRPYKNMHCSSPACSQSSTSMRRRSGGARTTHPPIPVQPIHPCADAGTPGAV
jgi:hypothetical protein